MGDAQLPHRAREGGHDAPRRHAVVGGRNVEAELAAVELEGADAAGIDHLHRHRMCGAHHPGDIVVDHRLLGAFGQEAQQEIVVAEHDIAALVDHGRVGELGMGVARVARHHRRLEGGGIAELGIAIAGEEGAGRGMAAAAAPLAVMGAFMAAMVLGHQGAGEIHLAAGDMAVDVDAAGHDDLAGEIEALIDADIGAGSAADAPVTDIEIRRLAAPLVGGIEDAPAAELDESHALSFASAAMAWAMACKVAPALGRVEGRSAPRGRATTPSARKIWPA